MESTSPFDISSVTVSCFWGGLSADIALAVKVDNARAKILGKSTVTPYRRRSPYLIARESRLTPLLTSPLPTKNKISV
jgi:hypothetical protein